MSRAPFQILVYPYRLAPNGQPEYAIFRRADAGFWQGIAGGGENAETPLEAARRETFEEAGLLPDGDIFPLDTQVFIPATEFRDHKQWGEEVKVIPQYAFGVLCSSSLICLSAEHTEFGWFDYSHALALVKFDGNKRVLEELNRRITQNLTGV